MRSAKAMRRKLPKDRWVATSQTKTAQAASQSAAMTQSPCQTSQKKAKKKAPQEKPSRRKTDLSNSGSLSEPIGA